MHLSHFPAGPTSTSADCVKQVTLREAANGLRFVIIYVKDGI